MAMKNKYIKRSRITEAKFRELIKYFSLDLEAQKIAILTHLNRNTINRYLRLIRVRIAEHCEQQSPLKGEIEVDESYFGAKRIKGKRGRGLQEKRLSLASSREEVKSTQKSFLIAPNPRSKRLSAVEYPLKVLSIRITGEAITALLT